MLWPCYLRDGIVYLATMKKTEAGFHVGTNPMSVIKASDADGLRRAIIAMLLRPIPVIPTPPREAELTDALKLSGAKS